MMEKPHCVWILGEQKGLWSCTAENSWLSPWPTAPSAGITEGYPCWSAMQQLNSSPAACRNQEYFQAICYQESKSSLRQRPYTRYPKNHVGLKCCCQTQIKLLFCNRVCAGGRDPRAKMHAPLCGSGPFWSIPTLPMLVKYLFQFSTRSKHY